MSNALPLVAYFLLPAAFMLGAVPFGFIAGKMRGIDLREKGSGNIGATNVLRLLGPGPGITVLLLDAAKGFLPAAFAAQKGLGSGWMVAAGLSAVLGHTYSPFVRFKGGKGVATSLGVLIALCPAVAGITVAVFALTVALTRYVSLGSMLAAATQAVLFFLLTPAERPFQLFGVVAAFFVFIRHRKNIQRLLSGTESRIGAKKPAEAPAITSDSSN